MTIPQPGDKKTGNCPQIESLPELNDVLIPLYEQSQTEGNEVIFLQACSQLNEGFNEIDSPYTPYTVAWRLWMEGYVQGFIPGFISGYLGSVREIAQRLQKMELPVEQICKVTGLSEDELKKIII